MTQDHDAPPRLTPTQRLHEVTIAALSRQPVRASEEVEVSRNAKGDWQFSVAGVRAEDETLAECATRVLAVANTLDTLHPLSRTQEYGRDYLPHEKGGKDTPKPAGAS